jgi:hypothetical protein
MHSISLAKQYYDSSKQIKKGEIENFINTPPIGW